jgi:hypothetical protein
MRRLALTVVALLTALVILPGLSGPRSGWWSEAAATSGREGHGPGGDTVSSRLHDGAKAFGEGLLGGVKFVGRTIISPFTGTTGQVGRDADATSKRLHKGAKGFGEGLLGGAKYVGRTVVGFFNGSGKTGDR